MSSRDAMIMPTSTDISTIGSEYSNVIFRFSITPLRAPAPREARP